MPSETTGADWSADLRTIEQLCAAPYMTPSRLFRIMDHMGAAWYFRGKKNETNIQLAKFFGQRENKRGGYPFRLVVSGDIYSAGLSHIPNELSVPTIWDEVSPTTDAIVELGCGYGRNLFGIRDVLEHEHPHIKYFGVEISSTGLEAARKVAALEPERKNITFHYFDFNVPTFDFLSRFKEIIFFTQHAIEQVEFVTNDLLIAMAACAPKVTAYHFEPVGWQYNLDVLKILDSIRTGGVNLSVSVGQKVREEIAADVPIKAGWNRNLANCLTELDARQVIKIDRIERNCAGNDIFNPTTLIKWRKP